MKGSLTIATIKGIPVKIHWSFSLLILFVVYTSYEQQLRMDESLWFGGYILVLFICVVLHEFGHAFAAKRYNVNTKDIILSPIGGVARLEQMPEKPKEELVIAIAGPLVNIAIALSLGIILMVTGESIWVQESSFINIENPFDFIKYLIFMNLALFVFNLVPAFPMDGGRILRALLSMKWGRLKATQIASIVGRILSVAFILFGFYNDQFTLILIGFFIYMMAGTEAKRAKLEAAFLNVNAGDIMRKSFTRLHLADPFSVPIELMKRNIEGNFFVFDSFGVISGSLPEQFIREAMNEKMENIPVSQLMSDKIIFIDSSTELKQVFDKMNKFGVSIIAVGDKDNILGVVDRLGIQRLLELKV